VYVNVCMSGGGCCTWCVLCTCRLPIVQGSAICFLVPVVALFAQDECRPAPATAASSPVAAAAQSVCRLPCCNYTMLTIVAGGD